MKIWQPILLFAALVFATYGTKGETNPEGAMQRDIEAYQKAPAGKSGGGRRKLV